MVVTDWEAEAGRWQLTVFAPAGVGSRVYRPADPGPGRMVRHSVTWVFTHDGTSGPFMLVNPAYHMASGGGPPSFDPKVLADRDVPGQKVPGNPPFVSAPIGTVSMKLVITDGGPHEGALLTTHTDGYFPFAGEAEAVRGALSSPQTVFGGLVSTKAHFR